MEYSLTLFKNIYDNKTHKRMDFPTWDLFESLLYGLSQKPGRKGIDYDRNGTSSPLISPATYTPDSTRANKNVINWSGWAAIDVDDHNLDNRNLEQQLAQRYGNYYYICYSTASSRKDNPKFRLVFKLSEPIVNRQIKHFWYALNTEFDNLGDRQTKDMSRMYYVPAQYPNAYNFIFTNKGFAITPEILMNKHQFVEKEDNDSFFDRLPKAMQEQVLQYMEDKIWDEKVNFEWTSYRDCPFFPKKLASEYMAIGETGWYHKMYQIMVATASNAIRKKYPIEADEIAELCKQFDNDNGQWYKNRNFDTEADRAIEYVYRTSI